MLGRARRGADFEEILRPCSIFYMLQKTKKTAQNVSEKQIEIPSGIFFDEDTKRKKILRLRELLAENDETFFDKNEAVDLSKMLDFFSPEQIALLFKIVETGKTGEGIQIRKDLQHFEKSKNEPNAVFDRPPLPKELFHLFQGLVRRFYSVIAHFSHEKEAKIRAVIKVAWTLVSDAEHLLHHATENDSILDEKTISQIKRQFLQVEQELDALDPKHPFMGNLHKTLSV